MQCASLACAHYYQVIFFYSIALTDADAFGSDKHLCEQCACVGLFRCTAG